MKKAQQNFKIFLGKWKKRPSPKGGLKTKKKIFWNYILENIPPPQFPLKKKKKGLEKPSKALKKEIWAWGKNGFFFFESPPPQSALKRVKKGRKKNFMGILIFLFFCREKVEKIFFLKKKIKGKKILIFFKRASKTQNKETKTPPLPRKNFSPKPMAFWGGKKNKPPPPPQKKKKGV